MSRPPALFDTKALTQRVSRSRADAMFLHRQMADELQERLIEVNRTFTSPAIVTRHPGFWSDQLASAKVVADDETLDLAPGAHDLILHAMSLHWANDPVGQLVQCRHALKPDGLLIATLFGGQTLQELRRCLAEAETEVTGGLSPRVAPMGEIRDLGGLLQRAGFALPVADSATLTASYDTAFHLMRDIRAMGEGNAMAQRLRHATQRAVFEKTSQVYDISFAQPDGRIPATFEIVTLTGWAPSADQPKAMRRGSAQQRLSDALGTFEMPLDSSSD